MDSEEALGKALDPDASFIGLPAGKVTKNLGVEREEVDMKTFPAPAPLSMASGIGGGLFEIEIGSKFDFKSLIGVVPLKK